jgi:NTE family protein
LQTRRLEAEVGLARAFGGRLERDRTAVGCPGDSTSRQFYHRNDASAAHAGLKRALTPKTRSIKLYLAATNVRTGKVKVFDNSEIGVDAVLASACLPFLFQAVEIDGEAYWDGGYAGNPPIFPLIYNCSSSDVLIVLLSPMRREELPQSATEILNRVNEISFNSSLLREMRAIRFVTRLIDDGTVVNGSLRRMRIHCVAADDVISQLSVASKLETDWEFLANLRDTGRERAEQWLDAHFNRLGVESTVDLDAVYM